jgi:hypothetical protein
VGLGFGRSPHSLAGLYFALIQYCYITVLISLVLTAVVESIFSSWDTSIVTTFVCRRVSLSPVTISFMQAISAAEAIPERESDELVRFREAWKAELQQKASGPPVPSGPVTSTQLHPEPTSEIIAGTSTGASLGGIGAFRNAVEIYRQAVQYEQSSQLDDALRLYRQAFRMDPHVDKVFHREERKLDSLNPVSAGSPVASEVTSVEELSRNLSSAVSLNATRPVTRSLASLLDTFPQDLRFWPEDERKTIPLNSLPDELLVQVLCKLDHSAIERFASISRKARVITLDSGIWMYVRLALSQFCIGFIVYMRSQGIGAKDTQTASSTKRRIFSASHTTILLRLPTGVH